MNRFLRFLITVSIVPLFVFGQSFTFTADTLFIQGVPGTYFEIPGEIHNISPNELHLNVTRTVENLPNANWFTAMCNLPYVCYAPFLTTFTIPDPTVGAPPLAPDSVASFRLDVNSDPTIPGTAYITVRVENQNNLNEYLELSFTITTEAGALYESDLPVTGTFQLLKNYPNPFNPTTTIPFEIGGGKAVNVQLNVYNLLGEKIAVLVDDRLTPGSYKATWDSFNQFGNKVSTGVYFYELLAGDYRQIHKMLLVK